MPHYTPRLYLVLRSGGSYGPEHVARIQEQVHDCTICVLTDSPMVMPGGVDTYALQYRWPGWWSKMELFRPEIPGPVFYMDLDSHVVGPLADMLPRFANSDLPVMLRDAYRPRTNLQSSVMFLPARARACVWERWMEEGPDCVIARYAKERAGFNGDQNFLEEVLGTGGNVLRWQDEYPGAFLSWKVDVHARNREAAYRPVRLDPPGAMWPPAARVIYFHGRPRPWDVGL